MLAVAILAAGKGTRMCSDLPKVLHKLSGKTLLSRVIKSCIKLKPDKIFVIVGHKADEVKKSLNIDSTKDNIDFVKQEPQNGTGHAIQILSKRLNQFKGDLLVLNGDVPLIESDTLLNLLETHKSENADASLITTWMDNPHGYGRVFQTEKKIDNIIEEKDCTSDQRSNQLINAGIYCFSWISLSKVIDNIKSNNSQKELYLTDTIPLMNKVISYELINSNEIQGVNNRIDLSKCEQIIQNRIMNYHMSNGVTFINPSTCSVSEECEIGTDVVIEANSHIRGESKISNNCTIGPNTFIENSFIDKNSTIINSTILESKISENVSIGPYSHIRPNTQISSNCKIGNFVEVKNSFLDKGVKLNHLSYIGDSNIGKSTNIGAGTITANFDGFKKNQTLIGEHCRIGANTVFVAPVSILNSVTTAAGSVINKDVESNSLAIARSKQKNILNWKNKSSSE